MHNACAGIIPRQKFHWHLNKHLNNEGQEWKIGHGMEKVKEQSKEGEYGWLLSKWEQK
jgi:hypothetical protein